MVIPHLFRDARCWPSLSRAFTFVSFSTSGKRRTTSALRWRSVIILRILRLSLRRPLLPLLLPLLLRALPVVKVVLLKLA